MLLTVDKARRDRQIIFELGICGFTVASEIAIIVGNNCKIIIAKNKKNTQIVAKII